MGAPIGNANGRRVWLPQYDELLRDRLPKTSASIVAVELNERFGTSFTRNAVIGRAHRRKIEGRHSFANGRPLREPWKALGIAKSTYNRRKQRAEGRMPAPVRKAPETLWLEPLRC